MWIVSRKGGKDGEEQQCWGIGRPWARLRLGWGCSGLGQGQVVWEAGMAGTQDCQKPRIARMHSTNSATGCCVFCSLLSASCLGGAGSVGLGLLFSGLS